MIAYIAMGVWIVNIVGFDIAMGVWIVNIVGFDNGIGLPSMQGYRDHPEIWSERDFENTNIEKLETRISGRAELIIGDIASSLPSFINKLSVECPISFVSIDVDTFSSSVDALKVFLADQDQLLSAIPIYFDDIIGREDRLSMLFRNSKSGQLGAINEFNALYSNTRYIDKIHNLKSRFPMDKENWLDMLYCLHVFDHKYRSSSFRNTPSTVATFEEDTNLHWPLA
jgi:hypothetical protein